MTITYLSEDVAEPDRVIIINTSACYSYSSSV
jgi:hypothetical protein